jgi:TRAP-type uncharacterized transport system fused permease subunit
VLAAIASFVLGLGLPSIPCYISVSVLVAPALIQMGVPKMAAHLFVLWSAIASFITPPEGMAFFVAAAVAQANPMAVGWRATLLAIGNFVLPFVFVYNPALLVKGSSIPEAALAIGAAALGTVALSAGIEGFFLKLIGRGRRVLFVLGGVLVFFPDGWFRLFGAILLAVIFAQLWSTRKKEVQASALGA